ncbi:hypothetical protein STAL104432_25495 [Streptomyces albus]
MRRAADVLAAGGRRGAAGAVVEGGGFPRLQAAAVAGALVARGAGQRVEEGERHAEGGALLGDGGGTGGCHARQFDEQFLDAALAGEGQFAGGGEVGEQHPEPGVEVAQQAGDLGGGAGGAGDQCPQVGVGRLQLLKQLPGAVGEVAQGGALLALGAQHGLGVHDEPGGLGFGGVGGAQESAAGVQEHFQVVAAAFEGGAEFVDDGAQGAVGDGGDEVVDAAEHLGGGCGQPGVGLADDGALRQIGAVTGVGPQVEVLLADGGEVGDDRFEVGGDPRRRLLDLQFGRDAAVGQVDGAHPAHGHAPVGDVGVLVQAAGAGEFDADGVVVAQSDVAAHVGVADADDAEDEDGQGEEGDVLEDGATGQHQCAPPASGAVVTAGSGSAAVPPAAGAPGSVGMGSSSSGGRRVVPCGAVTFR